MTDREWQDRYQITSIKGKVWSRAEIAKRAVDMAYGLLLHKQPRSVIRVEVESVLDDDKFMRPNRGVIPARIVEDVAFEAFYKLAPKEAQP